MIEEKVDWRDEQKVDCKVESGLSTDSFILRILELIRSSFIKLC